MSMKHEGRLNQLDARVKELEEKVRELQDQLAELQEKRGPGRPRKVANG